MLYDKEDRKNNKKHQEIIQTFEGYFRDIVYGTSDYHAVLTKKLLLSFQGYTSHPKFFDVMIKGDKFYYL